MPAPVAGRAVLRDFLPAILMLTVGLAGLAVANMWPGAGSRQYLVIAAPGSSFGQTVNIVRASDGGIVESGRFSNIVIASSVRPDFVDALRRAGAWLVLAAPSLKGCGSALTKGSTR
ncbi:MAG: hypothetical protein ABW184_00015 [Sphingobium sp.]